MSCKKELDIGYPQVTIIAIEWFFFWRQEMDWTKNSTKFYRKIQSVLMTETHLQTSSLTIFGFFEVLIQDMILPLRISKWRNFRILFNSIKFCPKIQSVLMTEFHLLISSLTHDILHCWAIHEISNYGFQIQKFHVFSFLSSKLSSNRSEKSKKLVFSWISEFGIGEIV